MTQHRERHTCTHLRVKLGLREVYINDTASKLTYYEDAQADSWPDSYLELASKTSRTTSLMDLLRLPASFPICLKEFGSVNHGTFMHRSAAAPNCRISVVETFMLSSWMTTQVFKLQSNDKPRVLNACKFLEKIYWWYHLVMNHLQRKWNYVNKDIFSLASLVLLQRHSKVSVDSHSHFQVQSSLTLPWLMLFFASLQVQASVRVLFHV